MKLEMFHFATNIPVRLYDRQNGKLSGYLLDSQVMPGFLDFSDYERILLHITRDTLYFTNELSEHYYSFEFPYKGDTFKLIAGPTIDTLFGKKLLMMISSAKKLHQSDFDKLESYFRSLPQYTSASLRSTEPLLRYLLCGSEPDLSQMMKRDTLMETFEEDRKRITASPQYHHSLHKDAMMLEAIKNGDRGRLFTLLYTPGDGPDGVLCRDNPLRSYKNLFIVTISFTTKASIDGGVDSESAYTLSDMYIQTVEEINSYEEVTELFISMFNSFLDLVDKAKRQKYTSQVYCAIDYISRHFNENISVVQMAQNVHLSESHLGKLFNRQTGMSIKSFIIRRRITEAANLLKYTEKSISDICIMAGFNDQSYMTNQFRKNMGTTPKKYREQQLNLHRIRDAEGIVTADSRQQFPS